MATTTRRSERPTACSCCGSAFGQLPAAEMLCPACLLATAIEGLDAAPSGHAGGERAPRIETLRARIPTLEFVELLGSGGSGWVYLAKQKSLDRPVAVKLLRSARWEAAAERFTHEAKTLARLSHPGLVTLYEYGLLEENPEESSAGESYLVMEYMPGPTLRQRLQAGSLSPGEAVRVTRQIADAVAYAHSQGVIHRDLKPENVIFASEKESAAAKVADFGIAKLIESEAPRSAASLTATGLVVGTPYYLAPESWSGSGEPGPRSDVYSLGVMLYEMLTGGLPVGAFAPPRATSGVSAALSDAVLRALATDPSDRFASVEEFAAALEASPRRLRPRVRRPALLGLAALVPAALLAGWAFWHTPWRVRTAEPDRTAAQANDQDAPPLSQPPDPADSPPAAESVHETPAQAEQPEANEPEAEITRLAIRGRRGFDRRIEFEIRFSRSAQSLPDDASLHWVLRTTSGERFSGTLPPREGRETLTVSESVRALRGGLWPGTLHLEERWGELKSASRRISPSFQVHGWHASGIEGF